MPTRILIVGAGAIGAFYGSRLACASNTAVSALCRSNFQAVQANGFKVTSPKYGETTFRPEYVFSSPEDARRANVKWDYLVVSTKALPDVSDDSGLLDGLVGNGTSIVLVQNGLGVEEPYRRRFPKSPVLSAVTIASAAQPSHGVIQHNRWTRISIGPYLPHLDKGGSGAAEDDKAATDSNEKLVKLLQEVGISDAESYDHAGLQFVRWHKIAINAAMNPSSVLSGGCGNQEMSLDPELSRHLEGIMNEVLETAPKVLGKALPPKLATAEQILKSTRRNSSGSKPSMWLDWEKGAKMELEVILGNPIRIARDKGFEMPRLQTMYALIKKAQEHRDNNRQSKL
ncbi:2-dehydropantoate 2-reductase [Lecanosticta acicola]|uniref:2-dehydropantoate 2-reductase n=1 Tax=Lecanosticta acicola TaxID=111012 RepID=A0AAI9EDG6_9PEZI|nr:2-dehydropantoate 2-reductase [Lecanosticta acicola]